MGDERSEAALRLSDEAHVVAMSIGGLCGGVGAKVPSSQPASQKLRTATTPPPGAQNSSNLHAAGH